MYLFVDCTFILMRMYLQGSDIPISEGKIINSIIVYVTYFNMHRHKSTKLCEHQLLQICPCIFLMLHASKIFDII